MDMDDLLSGLSDQDALDFMEIDLAMADVLASFEECRIDLSDTDRFLVLNHMRAAFETGRVLGNEQMAEQATDLFVPMIRKLVRKLEDCGMEVHQ